jgi:hypothetical protein
VPQSSSFGPAGSLFRSTPVASPLLRVDRPNGHQKLLGLLRTIVDTTYSRDCVLGYCLDLLLSGLEVDERQRFWQAALAGMPYPKTRLLLTLPQKAKMLIPTSISQRFSTQIALGKLDSAL